jgi:dCMP deaminase
MIMNNKRPDWDEYYMGIAHAVSVRGTCDRGKTGCVIVKDKHVLAAGYVGSPAGLPHCDDAGHQLKKVMHEDGTITQHCFRTIHAEQNAISQAAKHGTSINGSTLYIMMTPCRVCAMIIINSGIKRVVCEKKYHGGKESEDMFKKAGVKVEYLTKKLMEYPNQ